MTVPQIIAKMPTRQLSEAMPGVLATAASDFREMGHVRRGGLGCVHAHELDVFEVITNRHWHAARRRVVG